MLVLLFIAFVALDFTAGSEKADQDDYTHYAHPRACKPSGTPVRKIFSSSFV